ncbi:major capsid protein [Oceanobacter mangrovi]|uniref:major capsid protein n=1 Tax=Oceanobacter mangrovi TaxID=2862510 RepID=UPI001C8E6AA9|nr:major capsid protein [Oceanobacter mangrovi]
MSRLSNLRLVDPVLTQLAIGYGNNMFGAAEALFPLVETDKEGGKIPKFGMDHFRIYSTERALRAKSNRIQPSDVGSVDVVLDEHDLEYPIDYREESESAFPMRAHGTNMVTQGIQLRREKYCADMAQNPANYAASNKITLSGTSQFTDGTNSDPEGVVDDGKESIRKAIAKDANTMVIGPSSWKVLKRHPKIRELLSTATKRLVRLEDLQDIFEIENILIGKAVWAPDAATTVSDLWSDNIVLAYVPKAQANMERSLYEPSFGYTLRRKGGLVMDSRTEDGKIELVRQTDIYRPYLLGATAGYLISDTNAD